MVGDTILMTKPRPKPSTLDCSDDHVRIVERKPPSDGSFHAPEYSGRIGAVQPITEHALLEATSPIFRSPSALAPRETEGHVKKDPSSRHFPRSMASARPETFRLPSELLKFATSCIGGSRSVLVIGGAVAEDECPRKAPESTTMVCIIHALCSLSGETRICAKMRGRTR